MNFDEVDKYVNLVLRGKYSKSAVERRDYRKLEKEKPDFLSGYGKKSGLMYLVDVDGDLYIDINIYPNSIRMVFRRDDYKLLRYTCKDKNKYKEYLDAFILLSDEYPSMKGRFESFNNGKIPLDVSRDSKVNEILS
jgi:hypothetical protein